MHIRNTSTQITPKNNITEQNYKRYNFLNYRKLTTDTVSFKGNKESSAIEKYERSINIVNGYSKKQIQNMTDIEQKNLEGIQYGLKTFENLSFPQIYFLLSNMGEISVPIIRDCSGMCPVCNVNGRPKERKGDIHSYERMKKYI